jgi:hypothetical protein
MNTITVIIMMTLGSPHPAKDFNGKLCQQILCRTFDNRYALTEQVFDSSYLKYSTDSLPELVGDTFQLDSTQYFLVQQTGIDTMLQSLYDNDMERYNMLREILIKYTPNIDYWKPCIYYNTDDDDDDEDGGDIAMMRRTLNNTSFNTFAYLQYRCIALSASI